MPTTFWIYFVSFSGSTGFSSSLLSVHYILELHVGMACLAGECCGFRGAGCCSLLRSSSAHLGIDSATHFGVEWHGQSSSKLK